MYDIIVSWHSGREKSFENVESYGVTQATPPELVLSGGSWTAIHVPLDSAVAFWSVVPAISQ